MSSKHASLSLKGVRPIPLGKQAVVTPQRRIWPRIVLLPVALLVAVLLIEGSARLWFWWDHGVAGKSYGLFQHDPELGAVHKPNSYNATATLNGSGFRSREDVRSPKPAGSWRILCSGGSTTFCWNLTDDECWPERLQAHLRQHARHEQDQVLNGGVIAHSVAHQLTLARRWLPAYRPDFLLIHTGINEPLNAWHLQDTGSNLDELLRDEQFGVFTTDLPQCYFLIRNSFIAKLWDYRFKHLLSGRRPLVAMPAIHPWVRANFVVSLGRLFDLCHRQGTTPVLIAFGDSGKANDQNLPVYRQFRDLAVELAVNRDIPVCDLTRRFAAEPARSEMFISTGVHVTPRGAELMAKALCQFLLRLPPPNSERSHHALP